MVLWVTVNSQEKGLLDRRPSRPIGRLSTLKVKNSQFKNTKIEKYQSLQKGYPLVQSGNCITKTSVLWHEKCLHFGNLGNSYLCGSRWELQWGSPWFHCSEGSCGPCPSPSVFSSGYFLLKETQIKIVPHFCKFFEHYKNGAYFSGLKIKI